MMIIVRKKKHRRKKEEEEQDPNIEFVKFCQKLQQPLPVTGNQKINNTTDYNSLNC